MGVKPAPFTVATARVRPETTSAGRSILNVCLRIFGRGWFLTYGSQGNLVAVSLTLFPRFHPEKRFATKRRPTGFLRCEQHVGFGSRNKRTESNAKVNDIHSKNSEPWAARIVCVEYLWRRP